MLSIDYFAEFQVEGSCESVEGSGGSGTAEPSSDSPDEKDSDEEKRSKSHKRNSLTHSLRKHAEFETSDSLRLCTYELERAASIRHNEEVMQQLSIKTGWRMNTNIIHESEYEYNFFRIFKIRIHSVSIIHIHE